MKLPPTVPNRVSYVGAAIGIVALTVFVFLLILSTFGDAQHNPYAGILIFVVVPVFLLFGLFLIPIGRGSYQLYSIMFDKFPRPIPPPSDLRPARNTCETCHWPELFIGDRDRELTYFLPDESNSRWEIKLLVRPAAGGAHDPTGEGQGIHWHVSPAHRVDYIAADDKRQEIPWFRVLLGRPCVVANEIFLRLAARRVDQISAQEPQGTYNTRRKARDWSLSIPTSR